MVICIKRTSPSDQICHLSFPVYLCRNFHCHINTDCFQLLCCGLRNIHTNLITGTHTDYKSKLLAISVVITIILLLTSNRL